MDVITYPCSNFDADCVKGDQLGKVWIMDTCMSELNGCSKLESWGKLFRAKENKEPNS